MNLTIYAVVTYTIFEGMCSSNNNIEIEDDLYTNKRWLLLIGGYAKSDRYVYILYRIWQYGILIYIISMSFYAAYLISPDKSLIIDGCHVAMTAIHATMLLTIRLLTTRSLGIVNLMLNNGIYKYNKEETDVEEMKLRAGISDEIRRKSTLFFILFLSGCVSNLTLFPLSQLYFLPEEDDNSILNPYLPPYFFYMPFDSRTLTGYCMAYILNVILVVSIYSIELGMVEFFIRCTVQLKTHFQILNNSIKNVQKRAFLMYSRNKVTFPGVNTLELFERKEFQGCLNLCLKANIQHHHALLRFYKAFYPFNGACLLNTYILASLIYAAVLYLILQKLPLNYLVNFTLLLVAEQTFLFTICVFGEEIIEESGKTFITLYDTPWIYCSKSFNKSLDIMTCNTLVPLKLKAMLIDGAACIDTYGNLMSAMYKIVNLWKQSDKAI